MELGEGRETRKYVNQGSGKVSINGMKLEGRRRVYTQWKHSYWNQYTVTLNIDNIGALV